MSKVTYEEVKLAFLQIRNGDDSVELVDTVLNFMYQHRPPTFDEVVKAWEGRYEVIKDTLIFEESQGCLRIKSGKILLAEVLIGGGYTEFNSNISRISNRRISLINLTIRYLESQKEQSDET